MEPPICAGCYPWPQDDQVPPRHDLFRIELVKSDTIFEMMKMQYVKFGPPPILFIDPYRFPELPAPPPLYVVGLNNAPSQLSALSGVYYAYRFRIYCLEVICQMASIWRLDDLLERDTNLMENETVKALLAQAEELVMIWNANVPNLSEDRIGALKVMVDLIAGGYKALSTK